MKYLIALGFAFVCTSASADATLTCSVSGAGSANATRSLVVSDVDGARVIAWARSRVDQGATPAQAVTDALQFMLESMRTGVLDFERNTAAGNVQPIIPRQ